MNTLCINTSLFRKAGFASVSVPLSDSTAFNSSDMSSIETATFVSEG